MNDLELKEFGCGSDFLICLKNNNNVYGMG